MKIRLLVFGGFAAVAAACFRVRTVATSSGPVAVRSASEGGTLAPGVLLNGKLNTSLGMSVHPRDVVGITLSDAAKAGKSTIVPAGAVAYAHVVAVNSAAAPGVQITFDSLTFGGQSHVLDANITSTGVAGVGVQPIVTDNMGATTVAAATRLTFTGGAQLPAGSTVTFVVVNTIRLTP
jgi:hypothetical protein